MALPNFFLVGAAKAGTTWVSRVLASHPDVFISPVKEPNYFAFPDGQTGFTGHNDDLHFATSVLNLDDYRKLFDTVSTESAIGEGSHWYLYSSVAASNIKAMVPDARILAVLRNPIDRAYSTWLWMARGRSERLDTFEKALDAEPGRIADNWGWGHYVRRGMYADQIQRYLGHFPREQIQVLFYDDLLESPEQVIRSMYSFLGVDADFEDYDRGRYNKSGRPRLQPLQDYLSQPRRSKRFIKSILPDRLRQSVHAAKRSVQHANLEVPDMREETRERLRSVFRDDVARLSGLLDRDLTHWLD